MQTKRFTAMVFSITILLCTSCKKDWLDKKPNISLVVPTSLNDFQALLDNNYLTFNIQNCVYGEIGSDNYYLSLSAFSSLPYNDQNAYLWQLNNYAAGTAPDWSAPYSQVYNANVVLDGVNKLKATTSNQTLYNNVKGSALFYRSFAYYDMAQIFAKPYDSKTSQTDLGLPLRTEPILNNDLARSTVAQTYSMIISDLKNAIPLLPLEPKYKTRPSKPAAYGLLARVYLSMEDYPNAFLYADSTLQLYDKLIPYSSFDLTSSVPIPQYNDEVIFQNRCVVSLFASANIDSNLYASYASNDLRKSVFFNKDSNGLPELFGSYTGYSQLLFDGLATDEIFMIKAEAAARTGKAVSAMNDLNTLLVSRWKQGTYVTLTAATSDDALSIILKERRKELCFRGLRWSDLRRLNKDPRYAVTLTRNLNGKLYTLKPNDNKYVYQISALETDFNPSIIQNPR